MNDAHNTNEDPNTKLVESIKKFAASYRVLTPQGKTAFQNQINIQMKTMDERTRKLYQALIDSTKNDLNVDKTVQEMERADKRYKSGM
ncbi:MAG: hypothetical protein NTZ10_05410 [Candidatus Saganbacteria bacterium]|nr:hypothetical protein [Candidatus Saganbacteria bacterium]